MRKNTNEKKCLEKTNIKMFDLEKLNQFLFHDVTLIPLKFYYPFLKKLQNKIDNILSSELPVKRKEKTNTANLRDIRTSNGSSLELINI